MKRNNPKVGDKVLYRFYKSNLPKVIWDPKNDRPLANFEDGTFITDDKKVALILQEKGYPQIPVDATEPPNVLVRIPGKSIETADPNLTNNVKGIPVGAAGTNTETGVRVPVIQEGAEIQ